MTKLAQYLAAHGLTQEEFAKRSSVHQATISRLCSGRSGDRIFMPRLTTALAVQEATGGEVTVADLVPQPELGAA